MSNIVANIIRIRKQKGFPQEVVATELGISQATYARIESEEVGLTIERLYKIAKILETDVAAFVDASKITIQNQTNNEGSNGYVENLYMENKETLKKLIQTLEKENEHLKTEIEFLRSMIKPDP